MIKLPFDIQSDIYLQVTRTDERARSLADRHYSRKKKGARDFVGPGRTLVLLKREGDALWVSRKCKFRLDNQRGIECSLFRNESSALSSDLIKEAVRLTKMYFGDEPVFTYVDSKKIKSSNPGCCFKNAGFKMIGQSKDRNLVLLRLDK